MARHKMELRHLETADRHLAEGAERIGKQEALVARLDQDGHDTAEALRLLEQLRSLQEQSIAHRQHILEALAEPGDGVTIRTSDARSTTV
ncbi:hypothetical protein [Lichenibacterium dinghuense]|uniref:hypothetical protein n=1 Tax=Lichenibacterium dinghuense TaxID=2895977 RepID=UPI001F2455A4|nr:hypothetical protein [Lichenibacterium sp. 6Y81]